MSFSCADNKRYNDALVALAEGKYDSLAAAYAGKRAKPNRSAGPESSLNHTRTCPTIGE